MPREIKVSVDGSYLVIGFDPPRGGYTQHMFTSVHTLFEYAGFDICRHDYPAKNPHDGRKFKVIVEEITEEM